MTFDQTVLLWCLAIPAVVTAVGSLLAKASRPVLRGLLASLGWWLAVTTALVGCQGWQWWPEDSWRQAIWPLLAWVFLISSTSFTEDQPSRRWVLAGLLSIATAMIVIPSGPGWEDTFALHRIWLSLTAASCLINSYALERLSKADAHRWSLLVALAGLAGPTILAATTYGSLAQWALAMIAATLVAALFGAFAEVDSGIWTITIPASIGAAMIAATGRFYSYETYPVWVYACIFFTPATITLVDCMIRTRTTWIRILVSGTCSFVIVAACLWRVLLS